MSYTNIVRLKLELEFLCTLANLNKTVEDLFREATYKLNVDFRLFVTFWYYESKDGWTQYKKELFEGTENYVKVYIKNTIILKFYV